MHLRKTVPLAPAKSSKSKNDVRYSSAIIVESLSAVILEDSSAFCLANSKLAGKFVSLKIKLDS